MNWALFHLKAKVSSKTRELIAILTNILGPRPIEWNYFEVFLLVAYVSLLDSVEPSIFSNIDLGYISIKPIARCLTSKYFF